ncbi:hypothetical protein N7466_011244 [Penicillium verhagenii]|uniref:uncharacterized protein n=1 Tax=Penicillium verhagenii TaxID=1562060 RepID=UPI002545594C|nr:uncharacterized protein N7466_011244 [Penicillium verhagenii]KAJ5917690.1 hypothetical protein N7466_011244 [Penicillium verhagenii]
MPLFHDPDRRYYSGWSGDRTQYQAGQAAQRSSEQLLDEEHLDEPESGSFTMENFQPSSPEHSPTRLWSCDERQELIQRIKESSPWRLQYKNSDHGDGLCCMSHKTPGEQKTDSIIEGNLEQPQSHSNPPDHPDKLGSPADIQRPRSALHSGDFREGATTAPPDSPRPRFTQPSPLSISPHLGTSPTSPWFGASAFPSASGHINVLGEQRQSEIGLQTRSRAPSLGSFSSSYVLKVPTSPLVYQANNTDLDFSPVDPKEPGPGERANRRRTLPPESFRHLQASPSSIRAIDIQTPYSPTNDAECQSNHVPRRTLTSAYSLQLASTCNNATYKARRPSLASDLCPTAHAPMVGSYEESILRGRMSMNPSKPLDFTAQIGVLGKGKCKGHLKCPPHITVPFPAVFYSYPTSGSGRSISDDSPSPYVGQIDLENSLSKDDPSTTRRRRRHFSPAIATGDGAGGEKGTPRALGADVKRRREKKNRRAESPKCPPGGYYRIPQQGQLQIIIKNPHKTAVKLFLVPYDLSDMEPGTKTFIRQRSYSAGPIIDMPLSARKNYGTDRPEASLNATENPHDKPTLRYLIHLNICCPSRGRFYLHSSIRVVFANRVPDGKEKLRNENQLPEPRYSPYKPNREPTLSASASARLAIEKATRRRSAGQGMVPFLSQGSSDGALHWTSADFMELSETQQADGALYNNLNKNDIKYGGNFLSSRQGSSDTGESLLAKRLRGLDVHKPESFDHA